MLAGDRTPSSRGLRRLVSPYLACVLGLWSLAIVAVGVNSFVEPFHRQGEWGENWLWQVEIVRGKMHVCNFTAKTPRAIALCRNMFTSRRNRLSFAGQFTFMLNWNEPFRIPTWGGRSQKPEQHGTYPMRLTQIVFPLWAPALLLAAVSLFLLLRMPVRKYYRRLGNRCLACGYNLTGNTSGTCPECGTPIPDDLKRKLSAACSMRPGSKCRSSPDSPVEKSADGVGGARGGAAVLDE